nr:hypothetical protein [Pantoea sp. 18069]
MINNDIDPVIWLDVEGLTVPDVLHHIQAALTRFDLLHEGMRHPEALAHLTHGQPQTLALLA